MKKVTFLLVSSIALLFSFTAKSHADVELHTQIPVVDSLEWQRGVDTINFYEYVYMQNKPHGSSRWIPSETKIWQVRYKNGKKYQEYVNWTGQYKNGTHIGAYYQYAGLLFRA